MKLISFFIRFNHTFVLYIHTFVYIYISEKAKKDDQNYYIQHQHQQHRPFLRDQQRKQMWNAGEGINTKLFCDRSNRNGNFIAGILLLHGVGRIQCRCFQTLHHRIGHPFHPKR